MADQTNSPNLFDFSFLDRPEWVNNRMQRFTSNPPAPRQCVTINQWVWNFVDDNINAAMRNMHVSNILQDPIRGAIHKGIEKGVTFGFDTLLDEFNLNDTQKSAISAAAHAAVLSCIGSSPAGSRTRGSNRSKSKIKFFVEPSREGVMFGIKGAF